MTVLGMYTLQITCLNDENSEQLVGPSREECIRKAELLGWRIFIRDNVALCPTCNKKEQTGI